MSTPLHHRVVADLLAYRPTSSSRQRNRDRTLELLAANDDATTRGCVPGHVTVGAVVVNPAGEVLLTHHSKYGRWFQLGGHLEPGDADLEAGALREAVEESGIDSLQLIPGIIDVDIHGVPCPAPGGFHHDVRFLVLAPPGVVEQVSAESLDLGWFPTDRLPPGTDAELDRLLRHGVERAQAYRLTQ